jgi:hypothetical protein
MSTTPASPAPTAAAPRFVPLSRTAHAGKRWRRYTDYGFAASQMLVPVIGFELPRAAVSMPVAFVRSDTGYLPMAVLGLQAQRNLFIDGQGRWLADYVPAALRTQPFALGRGGDGQLVLCIDEASPLIAGDGGEPLFGEQGEPADEVRKAMAFLQRIEQGRAATAAACEALTRHNCIAPMVFSVKGQAGGARRLEGLFQADEAALGKLPDAAFLELRNTGALALAYAQLISLQKLTLLPALAARRAQEEAVPDSLVAGKEIDLSFLDKDGTFGFDAFR